MKNNTRLYGGTYSFIGCYWCFLLWHFISNSKTHVFESKHFAIATYALTGASLLCHSVICIYFISFPFFEWIGWRLNISHTLTLDITLSFYDVLNAFACDKWQNYVPAEYALCYNLRLLIQSILKWSQSYWLFPFSREYRHDCCDRF